MKKRINGKSFDFDLSGLSVHVSRFSLDITDNTATAKTHGVPDGYTDGDVEASGEIELDRSNFRLIIEAAKRAGSFRALETFDISAVAQAGDDNLRIEIFGVKLSISSLLDVDPNSAEKTVFKIPYLVTSPDFIRIDGVPYLDTDEVNTLI